MDKRSIESRIAGEKSRIMSYMREAARASFSRGRLSAGLGVAPDGQSLFDYALDELAEGGDLALSKSGRYMLPERGGFVTGIFAANERGFGFVERQAPQGSVYIAPDMQRGAIDGDVVMALILDGGRGGRKGQGQEPEHGRERGRRHRHRRGRDQGRRGDQEQERGQGQGNERGHGQGNERGHGHGQGQGRGGNQARGRDEGEIVRIVQPAAKTLVGALVAREGGRGFAVRPDDRKILAEISIGKEHLNGASEGQKVLAEITARGTERDGYALRGKVIEVIGYDGDPGVDISSIALSHGFALKFPEAVAREAASIPEAPDRRAYRGRQDLRHMKIITIDGEDSKDLDDAVSIELLPQPGGPGEAAQAGNAALAGEAEGAAQAVNAGYAGYAWEASRAGEPAPAASRAAKYRLGVHIADVSHYVRPGSALDAEALSRGTSLYVADRVLPMLPQRLSNGVCSLHPHVDRLALSVMMDIDAAGRVTGHSIFKSVINTAERMTYKNVRKILEDGDERLEAEYAHILGELRAMRDLALILNKKRLRRGALDFSFKEAKITLDAAGKPLSVAAEEITVANRIIEEFMIACNETVAERLSRAGAPFIYRTHGKPSPDKLEVFLQLAGKLGFRGAGAGAGAGGAGESEAGETADLGAGGAATAGDAGAGGAADAISAGGAAVGAAEASGAGAGGAKSAGAEPDAAGIADGDGDPRAGGASPKQLQAIIAAAQGSEYEKLVNTLLLRSMAKAAYTAGNIGHFGLASQHYCHFTSPIRRYPDLMIHRIVKDSLKRGSLPKPQAARLDAQLPRLCSQCSERERAANDAENETEDLKKTEYMKQFEGRVFDGVISNVAPFGLFVELDNTVEGLVRVGSMADDYYVFDEERLRLSGARTGKTYGIGSAVRVKLAGANAAARQIDFLLLD
ncbi:MAG: RNB domain-containing ribonuclease, partial [Clostridiales bacterium]|nr:RNB domain-containing ribonuclease [Clostridiales bacterium]